MEAANDSAVADWRVYIRPEGGHFVGLCAELRAIVTGTTIEDIVSKIRAMKAKAHSKVYGPWREGRVAVHLVRDTRAPQG